MDSDITLIARHKEREIGKEKEALHEMKECRSVGVFEMPESDEKAKANGRCRLCPHCQKQSAEIHRIKQAIKPFITEVAFNKVDLSERMLNFSQMKVSVLCCNLYRIILRANLSLMTNQLFSTAQSRCCSTVRLASPK